MYQLTNFACCLHCEHGTDGGPPHEDPCPEPGCIEGKATAEIIEVPDGV